MLKQARSSTVSVLGLCLVALLISGCSSTPRVLEISSKPVYMPKLNLPRADVLDLQQRKIKWLIVNHENFKDVMAKLKKDGRPVTLFALTDQGYANLGLTLSDIRAYIEQQKTIILAYENYYKEADKAVNKANDQMIKNNDEWKKTQEKTDSTPGFLKKLFN